MKQNLGFETELPIAISTYGQLEIGRKSVGLISIIV